MNFSAVRELRRFSKGVALLSLIVIVQQSSSFVFAWLCFDFYKVLVIIIVQLLSTVYDSVENEFLSRLSSTLTV